MPQPQASCSGVAGEHKDFRIHTNARLPPITSYSLTGWTTSNGQTTAVPAIAQDADNGDILMMAWMNRESWHRREGQAVYWSRSRGKLWRKAKAPHQQVLRDIRLDCDADVILLKVEQKGGIACHTGRRSCFYRTLKDGQWVSAEPVLKDPNAIYGSN